MMIRILFVCHGNTCRSIMAAALAKKKFGPNVDIDSAGLYPQSAQEAQMAIDTLQSYFGIDASNHMPKSIASVNLDEFDFVIAMNSNVAKELKDIKKGSLVVWKIPDPWGNDTEAYRKCALRINNEVSKFAMSIKQYYYHGKYT